MRIAYSHQIFSEQEFGGVSRYYSMLADNLFKQGQDVKIFAGLHRNIYLGNLPKVVVKGIEFKKYPLKSGRLFQWLNNMINHVQFKSWQPDIIHETYYSVLPTFKSDVVRITSVYDMIHELFSDQFSPLEEVIKRVKVYKNMNKLIITKNFYYYFNLRVPFRYIINILYRKHICYK